MKICPDCYMKLNDDVRVCECGHVFEGVEQHYEYNETFVISCPVCGRIYNVPNEEARIELCDDCGCVDIANEIPVKNDNSELCIYLEKMSSKKRYSIPSDEKVVLGRGAPGAINEDSFSQDDFSRNECIIEYRNDLWLIHTENNHGHLSINGERVPANARRTITNGDIITIYKRRFRVVM